MTSKNKYPKEVKVVTPDGDIIATKDSSMDAWEIGYDWGDDRFFGSKAEVARRMTAAYKAHVEEEKRLVERERKRAEKAALVAS